MKLHNYTKWLHAFGLVIGLVSSLVAGTSIASSAAVSPTPAPTPKPASSQRPSQPPAQPPNWLAQTQAATCANCHATSAPSSAAGNAMPFLGNLSAQAIQKAMQDFKTNQRPATVMHQLAKGYSDSDIERISQVLGKPSQ